MTATTTDLPQTPVSDEEMHDLLEAVRSGDLSIPTGVRLGSIIIALIAADSPDDDDDDAAACWATVRGPWREFVAEWREQNGRITEAAHASSGERRNGDLR